MGSSPGQVPQSTMGSTWRIWSTSRSLAADSAAATDGRLSNTASPSARGLTRRASIRRGRPSDLKCTVPWTVTRRPQRGCSDLTSRARSSRTRSVPSSPTTKRKRLLSCPISSRRPLTTNACFISGHPPVIGSRWPISIWPEPAGEREGRRSEDPRTRRSVWRPHLRPRSRSRPGARSGRCQAGGRGRRPEVEGGSWRDRVESLVLSAERIHDSKACWPNDQSVFEIDRRLGWNGDEPPLLWTG